MSDFWSGMLWKLAACDFFDYAECDWYSLSNVTVVDEKMNESHAQTGQKRESSYQLHEIMIKW